MIPPDTVFVRTEWMRIMGFDDDEIREQCEHSPPSDLDEELTQYNAMLDVQEINLLQKLKNRARGYRHGGKRL